MTDKNKLVSALTNKGYTTEITEGIVMVILDADNFKNKEVNSDITKIIRDTNYSGSWGMRVKTA